MSSKKDARDMLGLEPEEEGAGQGSQKKARLGKPKKQQGAESTVTPGKVVVGKLAKKSECSFGWRSAFLIVCPSFQTGLAET